MADSDWSSSTVSVYNVAGIRDYELELLFENKNKSNGGNVSRVHIDEALDVAYVTFEEQEVAERVLAKGEVVYNDRTLRIRRCPQTDPYSVMVLGLPPVTDRETLELYFENEKRSGGGPVKELKYEDGKNWALVTFQSTEVVERVLGRQQRLHNVNLTVNRHVLPKAIQAYPVNGLSEDILELYFDSRRHSNGGGVTSCRIQSSVAVIEFEEHDVVRRVLKCHHSVKGHSFEVDVFYPEVGITHEVPPLHQTPPAPFTVAVECEATGQFLDHSPKATSWKATMKDQLKFDTTPMGDTLNVTYANNGPDVRSSETWKREATKAIKEFLGKLSVIRFPVSENMLQLMKDQCGELSTDAVLATCDDGGKQVILVGFKESIAMAEAAVNEVVKRLSVVENCIPLPRWQLNLMEMTNHIDYMRQRIPGLDIAVSGTNVLLKGRSEQMQLAYSLLYDEFASSCVSCDYPLRGSVFGALQNRSLCDRVDRELRDANVLAAIEVNADKGLVTVHALSDADAERCASLIDRLFVLKHFTLPDQHQNLLRSDRWSTLRDCLLRDHGDSLAILTNDDAGELDLVIWHESTSAMEQVKQELNVFMKEERLLPLPLPVVYLFEVYYTEHLKTIITNINEMFPNAFSTTIELCDPEEIEGYLICGPPTATELVMSQIQNMAASIMPCEISITSPPISAYFVSASGEVFLDDLSNTHHVVCIVDDNTEKLLMKLKQHYLNSAIDEQAATVAPSHVIKLRRGPTIEIHCRDINTSPLDMIIVPADTQLTHTLKGIQEMMSFAGDSVKLACQELCQESGPSLLGALHETGVGNLRCQKLLHLVCSGGDLFMTDDRFIQKAILDCMEYVKNSNVKSVALKLLEFGPEQNSTLTSKAHIIVGALLLAMLGDRPEVSNIELVGNNPQLNQIMNDVFLDLMLEFGIEVEDPRDITGVPEMGAASRGTEASTSVTEAEKINIYGLNTANVESVVKEINLKCDRINQNIVQSLSQQWAKEKDEEEDQGVEMMECTEQSSWECKPDGRVFEPLPATVSDRNVPSVEYTDRNGRQQTVDFSNVQRQTAGSMGDSVSYAHRALPAKWSPMTLDERLKVIELDKDSSEYKEVEQNLLSSAKCKISVMKIERIQNPWLYQQYQVKKRLMDQVNSPSIVNQRQLYHGTAHTAISNINTNGFNRSYCGKNATSYGQGVYFAKQSRYSLSQVYSPRDSDDNRYLYQCLVLTGNYTAGRSSYIEPPPVDQNNPAVRYDSVVDNCTEPNLYVIFNDTQAYPEYLITFR